MQKRCLQRHCLIRQFSDAAMIQTSYQVLIFLHNYVQLISHLADGLKQILVILNTLRALN